MSKAIYIKDGNKMREIPELEHPLGINYDSTFKYANDFEKYKAQFNACKEYPCPPQHSFVEGVTYEEGKDYEIHHYNHGGFGKSDDYKATAIPINKESEDEIISELLDGIEKRGDCDSLHKKGVYDFIKQSFSIQRKQK